MKCIQYYRRTGETGFRIERVTDAVADREVSARLAYYVPKRTWKVSVRDVDSATWSCPEGAPCPDPSQCPRWGLCDGKGGNNAKAN